LPGFEELTEPLDHEELLWGNPAIACALLLAQSFEAVGWGFQPGMHRDLTGLPLHLRRRQGETEATPCAETWLTEDAAQRLLDEGLIPLASVKGQDTVHLIRFQSVADPLAPLAGAWGGGE
jgi:type VI secretion system protein ImpC